MAILCIKTPSSSTYVLIFQLLVLRPRPNVTANNGFYNKCDGNIKKQFHLIIPKAGSSLAAFMEVDG